MGRHEKACVRACHAQRSPFGLSGSEQMRRLQRDYGIKIGRTTFERWKNAYFKQSEEKSS